jgi:Bacterial NAD-glutamate dehydrogenase
MCPWKPSEVAIVGDRPERRQYRHAARRTVRGPAAGDRRQLETHLDVGDKANDAVRVDAADVRVRVIGEGGNPGVTLTDA